MKWLVSLSFAVRQLDLIYISAILAGCMSELDANFFDLSLPFPFAMFFTYALPLNFYIELRLAN